jgi:hypothetical protein
MSNPILICDRYNCQDNCYSFLFSFFFCLFDAVAQQSNLWLRRIAGYNMKSVRTSKNASLMPNFAQEMSGADDLTHNFIGGSAAGNVHNELVDIDWDSVAFSFEHSARALSPTLGHMAGDARIPPSDDDLVRDALGGGPRSKKRRPSDLSPFEFADDDSSLFHPSNSVDSSLFRADDAIDVASSSGSKMDYLEARIAQLEAQNSALQEQLSTAERLVGDTKRRTDERLSNVRYMFHLFNTGNMDSVKKAMVDLTSPDCALLTPSLFQQLQGQNAVLQFFTIMLDTFPDGIFDLTESTIEESGVFVSKFSFTGTKVGQLPSDVLFEKWKDLSLAQISKKRISHQEPLPQPPQPPPQIPQGFGAGAIQEMFLSVLAGDHEKLQHLPLIAEQIRSALGVPDNGPSSTPLLDILQSQRGLHDTMLGDRMTLLQRLGTLAGAATSASKTTGVVTALTPASMGVLSGIADGALAGKPFFPLISQLLASYKAASTPVASSTPPAPERSIDEGAPVKSEPVPTVPAISGLRTAAASTPQLNAGDKPASVGESKSAPEVSLPVITLNGHMMATYVRNSTKINRLVFVWNTTSLIGQAFGFSNGDLEVLNGMKGAIFAQRSADNLRQQK